MNPAATLAIHLAAALGEIAGCFAFWTWLRLARIAWRAVAGTAALIAFAWFLTRVDVAFAGRAYAALWRRLHRQLADLGRRPDRWYALGAGGALAGAAIILLGLHASG